MCICLFTVNHCNHSLALNDAACSICTVNTSTNHMTSGTSHMTLVAKCCLPGRDEMSAYIYVRLQ